MNPVNALPTMPSTSLSPPPLARNVSDSASPIIQTEEETTKQKRYNLTPAEQQALHLQKLLANVDREVKIPKAAREKELRAPRETIKNVSGSSAGAGSGEFHVYKHSRRREYERIKLMEDKARKEKEKQEYEEKQKSMQEQVEAKTNKNRAKREKKKEAKLAAKGFVKRDIAIGTSGDKRSAENRLDEEEEEKQAKRKRINAEGTAQIVFRRKEDEESEEE